MPRYQAASKRDEEVWLQTFLKVVGGGAQNYVGISDDMCCAVEVARDLSQEREVHRSAHIVCNGDEFRVGFALACHDENVVEVVPSLHYGFGLRVGRRL